jgi:hypothetical protein
MMGREADTESVRAISLALARAMEATGMITMTVAGKTGGKSAGIVGMTAGMITGDTITTRAMDTASAPLTAHSGIMMPIAPVRPER